MIMKLSSKLSMKLLVGFSYVLCSVQKHDFPVGDHISAVAGHKRPSSMP